MPFFKIASADITSIPLLRKIAKKNKAIVLSTGAATVGEIDNAIEIIKQAKHAGADAVKCGIGPGSCCTTRMVTGFGVPQFTAVKECAQIAQKYGVPLIADGGIRGSSDIAKSLAAGASCVMIGGLFAKTYESPVEKVEKNGKIFSQYRGQASEEFQKSYYGKMKKGTVAEGVSFEVECTGPVQRLIDELCGGVRSSFTYGGAKNIKEFQNKTKFRPVTQNYIKESNFRQNIIF